MPFSSNNPHSRVSKMNFIFFFHLSGACFPRLFANTRFVLDIAYFLFGYLVQILLWIDSQYHLAQKAQDLSVECVKLILKADEQYHLHEFASEAMYMLIAAGLKAAVAYKETPGYREQIDQLQYYEDDEGPVLTTKQSPSPPPPPSKSTSRIPWIWSRWH